VFLKEHFGWKTYLIVLISRMREVFLQEHCGKLVAKAQFWRFDWEFHAESDLFPLCRQHGADFGVTHT
jgi:hypothetical protein